MLGFIGNLKWFVSIVKATKVFKAIKIIGTIAVLAVGVKGFMQARQMMAKGQDILGNKTAAGGKLPVIYGTRRVGAQVIYMDVSANDSRDLYVVYALSIGECDEILGRTIELDGNPLSDSARFRDGGYIGSDKISSGNYSLNTVSQNGTGIDAGAGQFGSSPTQRYRYVMNLHHGAATQTADPMLVASMPNWTSAHRLDGVCYIAAHYGYDKEGIWSGVPQLTVQVRGKKVFDPRDTNQTFGTVSTYEYSDNPALTFLDYITNNEYGKGLTQSQINMSTFTAAANVCDTEVDQPYFNGTAQSLTWSGNAGDNFITIGGASATTDWWQNKVGELIDIYDTNGNGVIDGKEITEIRRDNFYDENEELIVYINDTLGSTYSSQTGSSLVKVKRFHCNGYLDANKNVMDNAKELLANMRGIFLYIDGKYELSIEDTGTSTFSINDNHIIADAGISVDYGNKDKKANKVIVEFFNANKKYELDTATVLHDATPEYYSDDGDEILEIKAEFPYISDPYIAYNMGKAILTRSRNQTTMQFLGTPEMYKLNVGDIVDLTYAGLGFSGKVCRVEALELQSDGLVAVSLIEYFDVYTWEVPPQEPVEELANLPSAYAVKAPTGLSFTDSNASSTDRPFISWNIPTDFPDYQYRINVKDSSNNQVLNKIVDVNNADLNFLPTGTNYVASITSLNTLGTESSAATLTFTVGDAPVGLGDIQANVITANEINVTNLAAISADLGSITAGSMNIGSGNFTVSSAGAMTATGATISGGITATSLNVTNATITGTLDASVITLNNEPLDDVLTYSEVGGIGLLTLNEGAAIDGDFVVAGNFEATGTQPDLIVGKVTGISSDTVQADAILRSSTGSGGFRIQAGSGNTQVVGLVYDAVGGTTLSADGGASGTFKINADGALAVTFNSSQNATFTGEVTADALGLPSQTPSTTTNKLYNVGGSLYFNGSAVGGGGTGDITAVSAGTNLNGGGTSGAVTLNLDTALTGLTSIALSGNMTVTGTVDGRDISSDGSKLDGIESGATADQTQAQINALGITATGLSGTPNITVGTISSGAITSANIDVTGAGGGNGQITVSRTSGSTVITQAQSARGIIGTGSNHPFRLMSNGTQRIELGTSGNFNLLSGALEINGTTVIDSSRNLTNIGTISSGLITANGGTAQHEFTSSSDAPLISKSTDATTGVGFTDNSATNYLFYRGSLNHFYFNSGTVGVGVASVGSGQTLNVGGGIGISSTTVIDASRNLTNIGTISSGAITSSGVTIVDGSNDVNLYLANTSYGIQLDYSTGNMFFRTNGGTRLTIANGGNATFAGTISSGNITSSGDIKAAGDLWVNYNSSGNEYLNLNYSSGGDGGILFRHSNTLKWQHGATTSTGNNLFWYSYPVSQTVMSLTTSGLLSTYLGYQVNGTTVIDASRNLTNIGTISSGAITSSGNLSVAGTINSGVIAPSSYFDMSAAGAYFKGNSAHGYRFNNQADTLNLVTIFDNGNVRLHQGSLQIGTTTVIDASRNITSSQLYIGSWTPSNATSVGRIGKVTDRPAGSITNQLGTNASSKWEIVDYDWTVVLASVTDAGNFTASGNVTAYSDERLKENIQTLDGKKALQMRGVSFIKDGVEGSGVIAQEIEEIAPELVITADDEMGTKSVAYGNLVGYLIETVKDQQKQIDELKQRLDNDS